MAGAGYKLFQTGDVLTAAQVNTYLNEQTVMVFANAAARTSALTSVLAEGMVSYLQDTNAVEVYNGSAWVGVSGAGDVTEVQAGTGISVASGTGPIPVVTNTMATAIDAEGDLIIGDAADAFQRLAIGSNTHVLTVDTSVDGKIKWAAPASGSSFAGAEITHTANTQTIANSTWTKVVFNSETYDVGGYAASGSTITIPSGKGGYYLVIGWAYFDQNATGVRQCRIYENGSPTYLSRGWASNATVYPQVGIQNVIYAAATDTVEFYVFQSSGGNLTLYVDPDDAGFSVAYLGA
jgi:hypothetical protein